MQLKKIYTLLFGLLIAGPSFAADGVWKIKIEVENSTHYDLRNISAWTVSQQPNPECSFHPYNNDVAIGNTLLITNSQIPFCYRWKNLNFVAWYNIYGAQGNYLGHCMLSADEPINKAKNFDTHDSRCDNGIVLKPEIDYSGWGIAPIETITFNVESPPAGNQRFSLLALTKK